MTDREYAEKRYKELRQETEKMFDEFVRSIPLTKPTPKTIEVLAGFGFLKKKIRIKTISAYPFYYVTSFTNVKFQLYGKLDKRAEHLVIRTIQLYGYPCVTENGEVYFPISMYGTWDKKHCKFINGEKHSVKKIHCRVELRYAIDLLLANSGLHLCHITMEDVDRLYDEHLANLKKNFEAFL